MAILVTGGAGFIGSHLCERLLKDGKKIICLDNFDPYYGREVKMENIRECQKNKDFRLIEADIRDAGALEKVFKENEISQVVHLAARPGVRQSIKDPYIYQDINVRGTLNLLEAARKHGTGSFIFGSSSSVYGTAEVPFREKAVLCPTSPYGASKVGAEALCHVYSKLYGIKVTCLRFFTVYGPRQRPDMAIHKFTRLATEGKALPMMGSGTYRDYTYISDIIEGVVRAMGKGFDFEVFNLGTTKTIGIEELISMLGKELGAEVKVDRMPRQQGDVVATHADIGKAKEALGYEPRVGIREGIRLFVEWYRNRVS